MNGDVTDRAENDDCLADEVADDALERAGAATEAGAITWSFCTNAWYNCGWPR